MASLYQKQIAEYHAVMSRMGHHGSHDMYLFHRDWHVNNRDPRPPMQPDRNWGTELIFGTNFLQMHHEMVKAADNESKFHMMHDSVISWYQKRGYDLPSEWNPLQEIPGDLGYAPDMQVFPTEIQNIVRQRASRAGVTPEVFLTRTSNRPGFILPKYFTRQGVAPGEKGELYTGARKLADFKNTNQLGCCLVFPHNSWHVAIGGAMSSTATAIADPIFYFGVHWAVDLIFDEYKSIQSDRQIRALDTRRLFEMKSLASEDIVIPDAFTPEEEAKRNRDIETSESLQSRLMASDLVSD